MELWWSRAPDRDLQLRILREELWRRQDSQARRLNTIETVAGVLVGGAALVSTIVAVLPATIFLRGALIFGLASAFVALLALLPRKILELEPRALRRALRARNGTAAQVWHADQLIGQVESREKLIGARFRLVRAGLVLLGLTLLCVVLSIVMNWEGGEQMGKKDDDWPEDVQIDYAAFEPLSESGGDVILGSGMLSDHEEVIRLTESDEK